MPFRNTNRKEKIVPDCFKKEVFSIQYDKATPDEYEKIWKGRFYKSLSYLLSSCAFVIIACCFFYIFKNF